MKNKIQERLNQLDKNDLWLAERSGLAVSYIKRIIKNKIPNPGILNAFKISRALGCFIEDLWMVK